MKRLFFWILVLIVFNKSSFAQTQALQLVENGYSSYKIVISNIATTVEKKAANELQAYIKNISGYQIPIVTDQQKEIENEIIVGKTKRKLLGVSNSLFSNGDAISIVTSGSKLLINGGSRKGCLYSVYTFLEDYLGCKMYTKDDTYIPKTKNISIPFIKRVEHPAFDFRTTFFVDALDEKYCDWHKINYFFEGMGTFAHTFSQLLPSDLYFKDHPEYFAYINGKRTPTQLCLSNNKVLTIVKDNLKKQMAAKPNLKFWSVSPNDVYDYCNCSLCEPKHKRNNGYMGTLLPFVNQIASFFPNKVITTLAYNQSAKPPREFIKLRENLLVIYCLSDINNGKPLANSSDAKAVVIRDQLSGWKKLTNNIYIWDYIVCFYNSLSPYPNLNTLQPNLKYYKDNNIPGVFEQGIGNIKSEFSELRTYLVAKLMWNPNLNFNDLINEFLSGFYGDASGDVRKYIDVIHAEKDKTNDILNPWENPVFHKDTYLSESNMDRYRLLLETAELKTKKKQPYYDRVIRERLALDFATLEIANIEKGRLQSLSKKVNPSTYKKQFIQDMKKTKIPYVNENFRTVENFNESLKF
ncbi:DUF4838 domain-containing protein [Niabella sp. CJ426]|uniref:DUF4838 domain-containing protein n=1 Tax=Niabella sp. CJ426 TaxID=3393740 RepID=UPI003CFCF15B